MDRGQNNRRAPNNIADARRHYERRTGLKYTQEDAARDFGVSLSTYRNYEQEKSLPDGGTAVEMAEKYGVTVNYLMGLSEIEYAFVSFDDVYSDEEMELVDMYRRLTPKGRHAVLTGLRDYVERLGS